MSRNESWSDAEVALVVDDYMSLLRLELCHQPMNKSAAARALLPRLSGRSMGAIERKRQNISAVLQQHGHYWISGYKPLGNFQHSLAEAINTWLLSHPDFDKIARGCAEEIAQPHQGLDYDITLVQAPHRERPVPRAVSEGIDEPRFPGLFRDYLQIEARNQSLGLAGELHALRFEQERLSRAGHERLAGKVEHTSRNRGDGFGFDILSYEPDGRERLIEVKTTNGGMQTPFFASMRELRVSEAKVDEYHVYRFFDFKKRPRCFILQGAISRSCNLDPISFRCSFR